MSRGDSSNIEPSSYRLLRDGERQRSATLKTHEVVGITWAEIPRNSPCSGRSFPLRDDRNRLPWLYCYRHRDILDVRAHQGGTVAFEVDAVLAFVELKLTRGVIAIQAVVNG